jgi:hypothetical protein
MFDHVKETCMNTHAGDKTESRDVSQAATGRAADVSDDVKALGKLHFTCLRVKEELVEQFEALKLKLEQANQAKSFILAEMIEASMNAMRYVAWVESPNNTVMTPGKDALLTQGLKGSAYTAAVYIGLISSVGYTGVPLAADTMAAHSTWTEAGAANAPTFAARVAATFGTASGGSLATSASSNFTMTGNGTVKGALVCFNGATSAVANTSGTLYAAGLFSGDKIVVTNDVIQVSYTTTLT